MLLQQYTACYLTTVGLLDESGGPKGFGFGAIRFCDMLTACCLLPFQEQQKTITQQLADWRGSRQQRDDICLLGFRS